MSIIEEYAKKEKILPKYIHIDEKGAITNLLSELKKSTSTVTENYNEYSRLFPDVDEKEFILLTILYQWGNKFQEENSVLQVKFFLDDLVTKHFGKDPSINILEEKAQQFKKGMKIDLNKFFGKLELKTINNFTPISTTDITLTHTSIIFHIDYKEDIYELFNHMVLSEYVPFSCFDGFYKFYGDFKPPNTWLINPEDNRLMVRSDRIICHVLSIYETKSITSSTVNRRHYSSVDISKTSEDKVAFIISTHVDINADENLIIKRILTTFGLQEQFSSVIKEQNAIKGEFFILDYVFNKDVLNYLIMNDKIISQYMVVNESYIIGGKKMRRKKTNMNIHFYFNPEHKFSDITISMSNNIVQKEDRKLSLPLNSNYVRIFIVKARDLKQANEFKIIFAKIMKYYELEYNNIVNIYRQYIPTFDKEEKKKDSIPGRSKKKGKDPKETKSSIQSKYDNIPPCAEQGNLKKYAPNIYPANSARYRCPSVIQPCLFDPNDKGKFGDAIDFMNKKGSYPLLFPLQDSPQYPQFYYTCPYDKSPFPGLRINEFDKTTKMFRHLPCCYRDDQRNEPVYLAYLKGEKFEEETKKHDYTIGPYKMLNNSNKAILPKDIENYFRAIDFENDYLRIGIGKGPSSILSVLNYITERQETISQTKSNLIKRLKESPQLNLQYQKNVKNIIEILEGEENFIDPKLFYGLLENYYRIHIFIFSRLSTDNNEGILDCPYHYYYLLENAFPKYEFTCFIYEHIGAERDISRPIQCEAIIRKNKKLPKFNSNNSVAQQVYKTFKEMYDLKIYNINFKHPILSQTIDLYGKCRMISFKRINIYTNPLPPIASVINEKEISDMKITTYDRAMKFLHEEDIKEASFVKNVMGEIVSINAEKGDVFLTIPIVPIKKKVKEGIISEKYPIYNYQNTSEMGKYKEFKNISKIMLEYMFYLFSLKYSDKINVYENILNFLKNNFQIIDNHKYTHVPRKFETKNSYISNDKLIVPSQQVIEKLKYSLLLKAKNSLDELLLYKLKSYISNYYSDTSDFIQHPRELILQGIKSVIRWINYDKNDYILYTYIRSDPLALKAAKIYYFQNKTLNVGLNYPENQIFLYQEVSDVARGLYVLKNWNEYGRNEGENGPTEEKVNHSFNVIAYDGTYKILKFEIKGDDNNKYNIIQFKTETKIVTGVLLPLK